MEYLNASKAIYKKIEKKKVEPEQIEEKKPPTLWEKLIGFLERVKGYFKQE